MTSICAGDKTATDRGCDRDPTLAFGYHGKQRPAKWTGKEVEDITGHKKGNKVGGNGEFVRGRRYVRATKQQLTGCGQGTHLRFRLFGNATASQMNGMKGREIRQRKRWEIHAIGRGGQVCEKTPWFGKSWVKSEQPPPSPGTTNNNQHSDEKLPTFVFGYQGERGQNEREKKGRGYQGQ